MKLIKADDKVEETMKKEEDGEKSLHDKKIDEKKQEFSKSVKGIMKSIVDSPNNKEEVAKDAAK